MATQSEFTKTPVPVLNRSAFNKSFQNLLTLKVGTLTPVLTDELIPDSTVKLRAAAIAKLPPLASDTFMRVKMHLEAFFVPYRVLYGGYSFAMSGQMINEPNVGGNLVPATMPSYDLHFQTAGGNNNYLFSQTLAPGTLADYLGVKFATGTTPPASHLYLNIFPFLAYHRIYDDWYRNPFVQRPLFTPYSIRQDAVNNPGVEESVLVGNLPYTTYRIHGESEPTAGGTMDLNQLARVYVTTASSQSISGNSKFSDGVWLHQLRQRNFGMDYFTSATPSPTVGTMPTLVVQSVGTADASGNVSASGNFTIGALRSINSLTQFAERNALAGVRYADWLKGNYGVNLSEQIEGRAQYLGRIVFDVYSKGVHQTGVSASSGDVATQNPFKTVGAQYGDAVGVVEDTLIDEFYCREPGCLMVIASLVPKPTYSTGMARYMQHYTKSGFRGDLANQLLENVGPQPIFASELDGRAAFTTYTGAQVFGYTDRFAEYKTKFDELHGLVRDGSSMQSFALQRSVGAGAAQLNSAFIEIPTTFLDQVAAVSGQISQYGCWMDVAFDYKVVQPLSRYSIPSLVMPAEHGSAGHTENVRRSGTHL